MMMEQGEAEMGERERGRERRVLGVAMSSERERESGDADA